MASRVPYELSCPACAHKVPSPFVRVGAVVLCGHCAAKYRIADEHVRRTTAAGTPVSKPAEAVIEAAEAGESAARQLSDGSVAGLSGLSKLMEEEPDAPAGTRAVAPPPEARPAAAPIVARLQARRDARRRNVRLLYLLAGVLGLLMAGVGAGLWWAVVSDRDVSLPPPSAEEMPLNARDAAMIAALPLLTVESMPEVVWEQVDEPHRFEPRDRSVFLRDEARAFTDDGREFYTATATADTSEIIASATLRLVLVDMADRAVARGAIPLALFGGGRQQKVRVPFPSEGLPKGLLRVDSWVEVHARISTGRYLDHADVRSAAAGSRSMLRLRSKNSHDLTLHRSIVVLRAIDDTGATIARYRAHVPWPIEPGMHLAIRLALPPPGPPSTTRAWLADAAGSTTP